MAYRPVAMMVLAGAWLCAAHADPRPTGRPGFPAADPRDVAAVTACLASAADRTQLDACKTVVSRPCLDQPGGETTLGASTCQMRSASAWQGALEGAYQALMTSQSPGQIRALRAAQSAWLRWREAGCAFEASALEGGSLAGVIMAGCLAETTAARAVSLIARQRGPEF